jgi:spore coat protein U-like protein
MKRIALCFAILLAPLRAFAVNCSWQVNPTNINFGSYSAFSTSAVTATSTFTIQCTPPAVGTVILSKGNSGVYNPRKMNRTAAPLYQMNYNLYMDASNTIIWGDGTSGTQFLSFTPVPGNTQLTATIYATIPAGLDVAPGTYTDTIQATLNWGTGTSNVFFTATATVPAECTVSTSSLSFGAYDPVAANAATPLDSTGSANVFCTAGTLATVSLDLGTHASGSTRRMLSGVANFLNYEVYKDAARSVIWNTVNTDSGTSTSKNVAINGGFLAYGRIPAGQDVTMGSYSDTLLVTVNY